MLVMLIEDQILAPGQVCQSCLMADSSGQPRWRQGKLRCVNNCANTQSSSLSSISV